MFSCQASNHSLISSSSEHLQTCSCTSPSGVRNIRSRDGVLVFLRYACIRLLGVGFTDGFFMFSCWGDRRRPIAYWAVTDWLLLFLVANTSWGVRRIWEGCLYCCKKGWVCGGRRIGVLPPSSVSPGFEEGRSGWVEYHYTLL
jgi:hypothetical protein